jgi:DNA-directed RNA polymerase specialized sigma24 family protein
MIEDQRLARRCRGYLDDLNNRECWGLSDAECSAYVVELVRRVPADALEQQLEQILRNYHREHHIVTALANADHADHQAAWQWVTTEIRRVAQVKGLAWSSDRALESGDLVQTAQIEIARALGDYHFASSLRTWLQSVVMRRLLRFHRDSRAEKRAERPASLDRAEQVGVEWEVFDAQVRTQALCQQIDQILRIKGDLTFRECSRGFGFSS